MRRSTSAPLLWATVLIGLLHSAATVDHKKFRTCSQSAFCRRLRNADQDASHDGQLSRFSLDVSTVTVSSASTQLEAVLVDVNTDVRYRLELSPLADRSFRVRVREAFPLVPRFEVPYVVDGEPQQIQLTLSERSDNGLKVTTSDGDQVVLQAKPFRMDFYDADGTLLMSSNAGGKMRFEHTRQKKEPAAAADPPAEAEAGQNEDADAAAAVNNLQPDDEDEPGMWEESFGGNTDSKPYGPQGVSMDFSFVDTDHVYGIPEHTDQFALADTSDGDPYRLYNLDVFEYELNSRMALYASIPFLVGHHAKHTTGVFWLNAAETWVDVKKSSSSGVLSSLSNLVSSNSKKQVDVHWMSESGIIDVFVFLGPRPRDVSRQYARITGTTPVPPEFSLGYHQCRWNYNDQDDVRTVNEKFDEYDIPMNVMWLDIEHTEGKKYFTWDGRKFSDSLGMVNNLTAVGRKLVTIVDPHIKKEDGYWVYENCRDQGLFVKTKDGHDYEGWCWPGASYYPDFLNPAAREYFAQQYHFDKYQGTSLDVYTWNDMNEPSVFNGPEVTMPKDIIHYGNVEHRDMHNIYGHLYLMATHGGHLLRSNNELRPFVLTRSAFAGSQRLTAIWTGDNFAQWDHLQASVPMVLSLQLAGMTFSGADVGGFFGNPDSELMVRWYQAGSFTPFFRGHAHIDTKRREPWLFGDAPMAAIRDAIRLRYSYLPVWYTLFYENEQTGAPPMRPLFYEFPEDTACFGVENTYLVGDSLLVHPVTSAGATSVQVHFPGQNQVWFDIHTQERLEHAGAVNMAVVYERMPVFQRGGTILPKKERVRRSSTLMHDDPYTLVVALDKQGRAQGKLYIDDGQTFKYKKEGAPEHLYMQFSYADGKLTGHQLSKPNYQTKSWLERVIILGLDKAPKSSEASLKTPSGQEVKLATNYNAQKKTLSVRKPAVNMAEDWEISFD